MKVKLPAGTKVTAVAAGGYYSLALTSTGAVLAWGYNTDGELGNGSTASSDVPVKVKLPAGTKVTAIAAGGYLDRSRRDTAGPGHSLALTSTGAVLAWGYNADGELGDGDTTNSDVPVKVKLPAGTKVTAIAAGELHSLAVTSPARCSPGAATTSASSVTGATKGAMCRCGEAAGTESGAKSISTRCG